LLGDTGKGDNPVVGLAARYTCMPARYVSGTAEMTFTIWITPSGSVHWCKAASESVGNHRQSTPSNNRKIRIAHHRKPRLREAGMRTRGFIRLVSSPLGSAAEKRIIDNILDPPGQYPC